MVLKVRDVWQRDVELSRPSCPPRTPHSALISSQNAKYGTFSEPLKINKCNWIKVNSLIFQLTDDWTEFFWPKQNWAALGSNGHINYWAGPSVFTIGRQRQIIRGETGEIAASHLGSVRLTNGGAASCRATHVREEDNLFRAILETVWPECSTVLILSSCLSITHHLSSQLHYHYHV